MPVAIRQLQSLKNFLPGVTAYHPQSSYLLRDGNSEGPCFNVGFVIDIPRAIHP